jgi:hypothetical protein
MIAIVSDNLAFLELLEIRPTLCYASALITKQLKGVERVNGIEPSSSAWKAVALPLSYTRNCRGTATAAYPGAQAATKIMPA